MYLLYLLCVLAVLFGGVWLSRNKRITYLLTYLLTYIFCLVMLTLSLTSKLRWIVISGLLAFNGIT